MSKNVCEINLTVLLTVVSGKKAVRRCLKNLTAQMNFADSELIVPFDKYSVDVGELANEFPEVHFHFVEDLGLAQFSEISAREHRLYDRRRAAGLRLARGRIVAMTEDHALPAANWCEQILAAHEQPHAVIGGAIENSVDRPLNWAWYFCDFGRYGRPLKQGEAEYVSDINVAYKRSALESVREVWFEAYHETTVHWTLQKRGVKLFLDERMLVFQDRPPLSLSQIWRERLDWGRIFAETRGSEMSGWRRFIYAAGTPFLLPVLLARAVQNMRRRKISVIKALNILPCLIFLLAGWSIGEFFGYAFGEPKVYSADLPIAKSEKLISG